MFCNKLLGYFPIYELDKLSFNSPASVKVKVVMYFFQDFNKEVREGHLYFTDLVSLSEKSLLSYQNQTQ